MVRKSPAVVRYRSDLAISLNNLGMAYCRAGKSAEADAAFGRARELFNTLADDYPDELAYRSSLAALLNNQALALAGVGRHADALADLPDRHRVPAQVLRQSSRLRNDARTVSKMYYNFGQSLRATGKFDEAMQAALARRRFGTPIPSDCWALPRKWPTSAMPPSSSRPTPKPKLWQTPG